MISDIYVNGFRSLNEFTAHLTPGLNIAVGPNGAGKTNFIDFLDFVGKLLGENVNSAIAHTEGVASTFSREVFGRNLALLEFRLSGVTTTYNEPSVRSAYIDRALSYSWYCRLTYDRRIPAVYIAREELIFTFDGLEEIKYTRSTRMVDGKPKTTFGTNPKNHPILFEHTAFDFENDEDQTNVSPRLRNVSPSTSLFRRIYQNQYFADNAYRDVTALRSINIDPGVAKRPSPVTFAGNLQSTGEGLAAVLYRLKRGNSGLADAAFYMPERDPKAVFESILSWCREINPEISDIDIVLDFSEALLRPSLSYHADEVRRSYSFGRLSDGTIKWIALVTMLFSRMRYSGIEEPENFLHPQMQMTFVRICRDVIARSDNKTQFIVSTHSLTLLDQCLPEELLLFDVEDGSTICSRVVNVASLNKKLDQSRFGLGYLYRSGVVYGTHHSDS